MFPVVTVATVTFGMLPRPLPRPTDTSGSDAGGGPPNAAPTVPPRGDLGASGRGDLGGSGCAKEPVELDIAAAEDVAAGLLLISTEAGRGDLDAGRVADTLKECFIGGGAADFASGSESGAFTGTTFLRAAFPPAKGIFTAPAGIFTAPVGTFLASTVSSGSPGNSGGTCSGKDDGSGGGATLVKELLGEAAKAAAAAAVKKKHF
jgi:hypothetical protein